MTSKLPSRAYLRSKLTQPLPAKDGGTLLTIHDAVEYVATLPKERALRPYWQQASRLILSEIAVRELTCRIQLALFFDGKLDLPRVEPLPGPVQRRTRRPRRDVRGS